MPAIHHCVRRGLVRQRVQARVAQQRRVTAHVAMASAQMEAEVPAASVETPPAQTIVAIPAPAAASLSA